MHADQIAIVRSTWALAKPNAEQVGALFYEKLFETDPSLRRMFPSDLSAQVTKLMQTLGVAVAAVDRLETITPALETLGRQHAAYGVRDEHYDTVGGALLATLAAAFGPAFTDEVRAAWATVYGLVAGVMRRAGAAAAPAGA